VVDAAVEALAPPGGGRRLGLLLPLREQAGEFHLRPVPGRSLVAAHASPYAGDRLEAAARDLRDADLVVMHCVGYTEAMRRRVMAVTGRPALLARRLVAGAVAQLL
jgi:protein AroM